MRTVISAAVLASLVGLSAPAVADSGFYVGFDLGQGSVDADQGGLDGTLIDAFDSVGLDVLDGTSSVSEDGFSYGLILGYQFLPYLAVEASYVDVGRLEYRARGTVSDGISTAEGRYGMDAEAKGPTLSALGILPFADYWSVYGRLGVFFADVKYEQSLTIDGASGSASDSSSSENLFWGVGAGYTQASWTLRLEYQQYMDLGDEDVAGEADASRITIGAIYSF